jgi:predicted DNA-binding transcriptional regulator AlpA
MKLLPLPIPAPPPDRGRLLDAKQVAAMVGGSVSQAWVRRNLPHKVVLGHRTVRWFEFDVRRYLEELRTPS